MRGLKELPHSCFSFLLQISSEPFSVKDYQLIQYLIPVPVSLRPLFDYVLAGKIQHLFQCRIAWEYAFRFRDFPILAVQSFYDIPLMIKFSPCCFITTERDSIVLRFWTNSSRSLTAVGV